MPDAAQPGMRPCPDRVIGRAVPGTALAADKMACHLRHRHALGQAKATGIDVEVPLRTTRAAMDLQQLSVPDQVADGDKLGLERLGLAPAAGLFLSLSSSTSSGDQPGDFFGLIIRQPLVRERDSAGGCPYAWASARPLASVTR
jgi:hypothetical protein